MLFDNCTFDFTAFTQEAYMWHYSKPRLNDSVAVVGSSVAGAIRFMKLDIEMAWHMLQSFQHGYRIGQPIIKRWLYG
jgi:hypothetical protein